MYETNQAGSCEGSNPWVDLGVGLMLEYGYVAYHIKGNKAYNNMFANMLTIHTPFTLGVGVNMSLSFLKEVRFYIKLTRMEHRTPCKHIFPSTPRWGQEVKTIFCLKVVMLPIKLKEKKCRTLCKLTLTLCRPLTISVE